MTGRIRTLAAFLSTLRVARMSRPAFERWQAKMLKRWLTNDLRKVAFYRDHAPELAALPIVDKAVVMERFADFNVARITADQGWAAWSGSGMVGAVAVGASTGTSGNRALYTVSPAERDRWLGTILAKTLPGFLFRRERVAVILPQSSVLYEGANQTGRIRLKFFDLRAGPERWSDALSTFDPTTIVAPPRVLRWLADGGTRLSPRRIFSAAETLDPIDRAVIEGHFKVRLGQIYMATEGLFAVSCAHGRLHLAEDTTHFEFLPIGNGLVSPLVTGFRRSFQIMARYRMNDLLRLSYMPCPCGSPLRVVDEIVGRLDDAFIFGSHIVTPDILRNAVLDASRAIDDFRVQREGERQIALLLKPELPEADALAARAAIGACFATHGIDVSIELRRVPLIFETGQKLRRIENRWRVAR